MARWVELFHPTVQPCPWVGPYSETKAPAPVPLQCINQSQGPGTWSRAHVLHQCQHQLPKFDDFSPDWGTWDLKLGQDALERGI